MSRHGEWQKISKVGPPYKEKDAVHIEWVHGKSVWNSCPHGNSPSERWFSRAETGKMSQRDPEIESQTQRVGKDTWCKNKVHCHPRFMKS